MPGIDLTDLPPDVRADLLAQLGAGGTNGARKRRRRMTLDEVRSLAFRVTGLLASLTPAERARVIAQVSKLNDV